MSAHEKRNHPHEYGHADAEVRLTADLERGDDPDMIIADLQSQARTHVKQELDGWIASIEEQRRVESLQREIASILTRMRYDYRTVLQNAKAALRQVRELPIENQARWEDELREELRRAASRKLKAQEPPPDAPEDEDEVRICSSCGAVVHPDGACFYCEADEMEPAF